MSSIHPTLSGHRLASCKTVTDNTESSSETCPILFFVWISSDGPAPSNPPHRLTRKLRKVEIRDSDKIISQFQNPASIPSHVSGATLKRATPVHSLLSRPRSRSESWTLTPNALDTWNRPQTGRDRKLSQEQDVLCRKYGVEDFFKCLLASLRTFGSRTRDSKHSKHISTSISCPSSGSPVCPHRILTKARADHGVDDYAIDDTVDAIQEESMEKQLRWSTTVAMMMLVAAVRILEGQKSN
ncbi:hypothetical protein B0H13DRAFT_1865050 [Mycena leptocephala]|nr:hypothetical protein B0H13DRAFT_1865050 [Mycena leptocephala]